MKTTIISQGNSAVVITSQPGDVVANLYVNARNGIADADITLLRWKGKTMEGALKWAAKQLGTAPPKAAPAKEQEPDLMDRFIKWISE